MDRKETYSITSSALASEVAGTERPSTFAVGVDKQVDFRGLLDVRASRALESGRRDTVAFSVLPEEWPQIRERLDERLQTFDELASFGLAGERS